MQVNDSPHLSVKSRMTALKYLEEKEEEIMCLQEAHDKLVNALADAEKIPAEISIKLNQLGDKVKKLNQILEDYKKFLKDNGVNI